MDTLKKLTVLNTKVTVAERRAGIIQKVMKVYRPEGFYVCWVEFDKLELDEHQRKQDNKHISNIYEAYNPRYVDMPICTCRADGSNGVGKMTVYVEDHNHTRQVMDQRDDIIVLEDGRKVIQCLVAFDMDHKEAAKLFSVKNSSAKKVSPWTSFFAGWIGGSKKHTEIVESARRHNLTLAFDPVVTEGVSEELGKNADLVCPSEYLKIYDKYGIKFLDSLFALHKRCFKKEKIQLAFLRALVNTSVECEVAPVKLARYFVRKTMKDIMDEARIVAMECGQSRVESVIRICIEHHIDVCTGSHVCEGRQDYLKIA